MFRSVWVLACGALAFGLALSGPGRAQPGAAPNPSSGPSFACASPSEIEAIICQDAALSAADRHMAALYQMAKPGPRQTGSNQLGAQRYWLKDRDRRCAAGAWRKGSYRSLRDCVADAYHERMQALAVAALLTNPQAALAELRTLNPKAAPYYAALVDYATIEDPAARRRAVEAKLAPLYAAAEPNFRDNLDSVGKDARTAHDAASSDAGLAEFFDVSAVMGDVGLTWPCAVLLRRPGLLAGLRSLWGGAIDGQIPESDCEDELPAPYKIESLGSLALDAQPSCGGTIRFSTGRDLAMLKDAVRLHQRDGWRRAGAAPDGDQVAFKRKHAALVRQTEAALASYFAGYFKIDPPQADADGRDAAGAIIATAFGYCE
jgi:uncharacterized protein